MYMYGLDEWWPKSSSVFLEHVCSASIRVVECTWTCSVGGWRLTPICISIVCLFYEFVSVPVSLMSAASIYLQNNLRWIRCNWKQHHWMQNFWLWNGNCVCTLHEGENLSPLTILRNYFAQRSCWYRISKEVNHTTRLSSNMRQTNSNTDSTLMLLNA